MPFKTAHVRSNEPMPMLALQDLAKAGFSGQIDGAGLVTFTHDSGSDITMVIQQAGDTHNFKSRVITVTFGTKDGERDFHLASVCTEDILGQTFYQTFFKAHDLNKQILVATPLGMLVKAASYAHKQKASGREQSEVAADQTPPATEA